MTDQASMIKCKYMYSGQDHAKLIVQVCSAQVGPRSTLIWGKMDQSSSKSTQIDPKLVPSQLHIAVDWLHVALGWPKLAPRWLHESPKRRHDGPTLCPSSRKMVELGAQDGQDRLHVALGSPKLAPRRTKLGPRRSKVGPRWPQVSSSWLQVGPKIA